MAKRRRDRFAAGRYLEEHGNKFRVVLRVPPSLVSKLGKTKLKETLNTTSRAEADTMKWPVLARLKQQIAEAKAGREPHRDEGLRARGALPAPHSRDAIAREALDWRQEIEEEDRRFRAGIIEPWELTPTGAIKWCIRSIAEEIGHDEAVLFESVVEGNATTFAPHVDEWLQEANFAGRTEAAYRQAVGDLTRWCESTDTLAAVEAIAKRVAGQFITARFVVPKAAPATANKAITALASFWRWMNKRGHTDLLSPWIGQFLSKTQRGTAARDPGEAAKRPFEDDEVATLLHGLADPLLAPIYPGIWLSND